VELRHAKEIRPSLLFIPLFFCLVFTLYFYSQQISPDFRIFYLQSERFVSGVEVYPLDSSDVSYNGPLLVFLLAPLTLIDLQTASFIFSVANILVGTFCVVFFVNRVSNQLFTGITKSNKPIITACMLYIFFFGFVPRSIISNGQVGLFLLFTFIALVILFTRKEFLSNFSFGFNSGLCIFVLLELKPNLMFLIPIYLLLIRAYSPLIYSTGLFLILEVSILLSNPTASHCRWVHRLFLRGSEVSKQPDLDQSSVAALLRILFDTPQFIASIMGFVLAAIYFVLYMRRILFEFRPIDPRILVSIAVAAPILSPYLHRQDIIIPYFMSTFWIALTLMRLSNTAYLPTLFIVVLIGNWGNSSIYLLMLSQIYLFWLFAITRRSFVEIFAVFAPLSTLQLIQIHVLVERTWQENYIISSVIVAILSYLFPILSLQKFRNNTRKIV
jgi:hypothetical protein